MKVNTLVSSKLLDKKWKEKDLIIHKRKLSEIKMANRPQSIPFRTENAARNAKKDAVLERKSFNLI